MATTAPEFPALHVVSPKHGNAHTHTAIMLHGRASDGEEFAEDLFEMKLSDKSGDDLQSRFPSWRWVFPTSQSLWSSVFKEDFSQWFDIYSLTDVDAQQEVQMEGIRQSIEFLRGLVEDEVRGLKGAREKLFICGISMGGAIGLLTLLSQNMTTSRVGGFVGLSCWLPFAEAIKGHFEARKGTEVAKVSPEEADALKFITKIFDGAETSREISTRIPVFLGHGTDDAYVDVSLGRKVKDALELIGFVPEWREYTGAEQEGHWIKEHEELVDIAAFLTAQIAKSAVGEGKSSK